MKYQLNITLTEEDYIAFNNFHAIESKQAQKTIKKSRTIMVCCLLALMVFVVISSGWNTFSATYIALLLPLTILLSLFFEKMMHHTVKTQVKLLKKTGKLPFDPNSCFEFYDDKLAESTPSKRTEQSYASLERVCLIADRYILLYNSSVGAYILPVAQVKTQVSYEEFWKFLCLKCKNIEQYASK